MKGFVIHFDNHLVKLSSAYHVLRFKVAHKTRFNNISRTEKCDILE